MEKMSSAILISIILLIMEFWICCLARNSTFGCIEGEMKALLRFKASLEDPSNRLSPWNWKNKDCCAWQGVACDKITGHVIKLDLNNKLGDDWMQVDNMLHGKTIDSSLLELKYLRYLDLSWNDFKERCVLQHLSSLRKLDLSRSFSARLVVDSLMWASNLSSLVYLDMSSVDLSSTKDIVKVLQMLPSLVELRLSCSGLDNTHLPHACVNSTLLTNVQYLDLSGNSLEGVFPCFLPNMTSLRFLDLSVNRLNFSLTHLLPLKKLAYLNLYWNSLHHKADSISKFLWGNCHLKSLTLKENDIYGDISGLFKNLSGCRSHNLESLNLGYNKLDGHLPTSLGKLSALRELYLNENQLSGEIPISLGQLSNLEILYISHNSFTGTLSEAHFANLSKLVSLEASFTMLKFGVGYDWVPPFQLKSLFMGSSRIGGQFPQWLQTQKALIGLNLSNCSITGTLPKWLHSMNLTYLDLSDNNITGPIPELPSSMRLLYLSDNMITHLPSNLSYMRDLVLSGNMITHLPSKIGNTIPLLQSLELDHNFINGSIPDSLCDMKDLYWLDLSQNRLSGNLPDCWQNLHDLQFVKMSSNELSGVIPNSIGGAYSLQVLHLNDNNLVGQLPSTLRNCTQLQVLDIGGNSLSGKLPEWIGNDLLHLQVLRLRENKFYGTNPPAFCELSCLQVLDLANNMLTGNIPHCFGNFSSMISGCEFGEPWFVTESFSQVIKGLELEFTTNGPYVVNLDLSSNHLVGEIPSELTTLSRLLGLNLSHNHLRGEIPAKIGNLEALESLDLSNNNLSGTIPDSLSNLSFLSHLNLSYNNLSGQIPTGRQLQTLDDPSIYDGNPHLCGAPLLKKCLEAPIAPNVENHEADDGDKAVKICFYAVVVAGFATGFWGVIGVLVVKTKWRQVYFEFIEAVMDKMLGC